jgi:hypothetical protein
MENETKILQNLLLKIINSIYKTVLCILGQTTLCAAAQQAIRVLRSNAPHSPSATAARPKTRGTGGPALALVHAFGPWPT